MRRAESSRRVLAISLVTAALIVWLAIVDGSAARVGDPVVERSDASRPMVGSERIDPSSWTCSCPHPRRLAPSSRTGASDCRTWTPPGVCALDAVARYLQDVAVDDVDETGWGSPEHLWVVRRYQVDVLTPFLTDREVDLTTWCSGLAPVAAGRRTTITGDQGGTIEVDSSWIHLGPDGRPSRLDESFGVYAEAAGRTPRLHRLGAPGSTGRRAQHAVAVALGGRRPDGTPEQRRALGGRRGATRALARRHFPPLRACSSTAIRSTSATTSRSSSSQTAYPALALAAEGDVRAVARVEQPPS